MLSEAEPDEAFLRIQLRLCARVELSPAIRRWLTFWGKGRTMRTNQPIGGNDDEMDSVRLQRICIL